jgi:radical SAM protein with 4Fe4S-binding SPASM domain
MMLNRSWLEITTKIGCKVNCHFCPQSTLVKKYKSPERLMSLENFKKIISTIPKNIEIHFSGYAEPLLNPAASLMMVYAKKNGYKVILFTTLVGLNETNLQLMKEAKIPFIKIHVPDTIGMRIDEDLWIENHNLFLKYNFQTVKYMAMGPVTEKIKNYLLKSTLPSQMKKHLMISRAGLIEVKSKIQNKIVGPITCSINKWHQNVVLPDGNVYLCCNDYGLTSKLGNLLNEDYSKIYEKGEELKQKYKYDENAICRSCEYAVAIK